jgi:hypothetical protein
MRQDVAKEQHESETRTKISSFSKRGLNNTKYVGYIKCFYDWCQNLRFYMLWQVNLFYDTQSEFQNKVVLPKETRDIHFLTFLNIFSVALL